MATRTETNQKQLPIRILGEAELDAVNGGSIVSFILHLFHSMPRIDDGPVMVGGQGNDTFVRNDVYLGQ